MLRRYPAQYVVLGYVEEEAQSQSPACTYNTAQHNTSDACCAPITREWHANTPEAAVNEETQSH